MSVILIAGILLAGGYIAKRERWFKPRALDSARRYQTYIPSRGIWVCSMELESPISRKDNPIYGVVNVFGGNEYHFDVNDDIDEVWIYKKRMVRPTHYEKVNEYRGTLQ